jgi:hypothetical protein
MRILISFFPQRRSNRRENVRPMLAVVLIKVSGGDYLEMAEAVY